jgi:hypothetical protein
MGRVGRAVRVLSFLLPFATAVAPTTVDAQTCGLSAGGTLSNVINSYYPGTAERSAGRHVDLGRRHRSHRRHHRHRRGRPPPRHPDAGRGHQHHERRELRLRTPATAHGVTALNSAGLYEYVVAQGAVAGRAPSTIRGNGTGRLPTTGS